MFVPAISSDAVLRFLPGLEYGRAEGSPLLLDLLLPEMTTPRPPLSIWLHGGGWFSGSRANGPTYWCALHAAHGFATASVDYRLSQDAPFPAQIKDIKIAIRWLRAHADDYGFDPNWIGIWGHSAGGHLASLAGVTGNHPTDLEPEFGLRGVSSAVQAVATASASADFDHWWQPDEEWVVRQLFDGDLANTDLLRLASPLAHVGPDAPPFLIAHGTLDETVPYDQALRLQHALEAAGVNVDFVEIEDGYHNWNVTPDSTWPKVRYMEFAQVSLRFFCDELLRERWLKGDRRD